MGRGIIAIFANNLPQFEYKQFYANRFENLAEMNNFLVGKKKAQLTQEEMKNLNRSKNKLYQ